MLQIENTIYKINSKQENAINDITKCFLQDYLISCLRKCHDVLFIIHYINYLFYLFIIIIIDGILGVIWPIEGMPSFLRRISQGLPLTMATTALRAMLTRGWDMGEMDVYLGFISTISWIILFLTISILVLKFKRG